MAWRPLPRRLIVRRTLLVPLCLSLACAFAIAPRASADPARTGYPSSIGSTGDSITRAFQTCPTPYIDCPANSWSTGTSGTVNSHYSRILAANPPISGNSFNDAVSGAKMAALNAEVTTVNGQHVDYATILMGANDVCTSSESTMTDVATFGAQFQTAMNTLTVGSPDARIFVASIPDIYNLWSILHTNSTATLTWTMFAICQSMLANPTSAAQADVDRRARVRQRNIDFNAQLAQVCAQYVHCRFDNNVGFNTAFTTGDVSTVDYFHPSLAGQALAASVTYGVTFDFTDNVPPVSTAATALTTGGLTVTLTATDNVGVSGIEYRIGSGGWVRYTGPVFLAAGATLTYRAVDVNGNIEATKLITAPTPVGGIARLASPTDAPGGGSPFGRWTAAFAAAAATVSALVIALARRRRRWRT